MKMCRLAHPMCLSIYHASKNYMPAYYRLLKENEFLDDNGNPIGNFPKLKKTITIMVRNNND